MDNRNGGNGLGFILFGIALAAIIWFVVLPNIGGDLVITIDSPGTANPTILRTNLGAEQPIVIPTSVHDLPMTDARDSRIDAEIAQFQGAIVSLNQALAECKEAERLGKWGNVAFPCQQIEGQIVFVQGQLDALKRASGKE